MENTLHIKSAHNSSFNAPFTFGPVLQKSKHYRRF